MSIATPVRIMTKGPKSALPRMTPKISSGTFISAVSTYSVIADSGSSGMSRMLDREVTCASGLAIAFLPAAIAATAAPAKSLAATFEPTSSFGGESCRLGDPNEGVLGFDLIPPAYTILATVPCVERLSSYTNSSVYPGAPASSPSPMRAAAFSRFFRFLASTLARACSSFVRRVRCSAVSSSMSTSPPALFTAARTTCSLGLGNNPAMVPPNMNLLSAETALHSRPARFASCSSAISRSCAGSLVHSSTSSNSSTIFRYSRYTRISVSDRISAPTPAIKSFPMLWVAHTKVPPTAAMKTTAVMEAMNAARFAAAYAAPVRPPELPPMGTSFDAPDAPPPIPASSRLVVVRAKRGIHEGGYTSFSHELFS